MKFIGHRGARGLAAENTLASIHAALDCGVGAIEIDVRVTADNVVLLNHDPYIIDSNGRKVMVEATNFADLQAIKHDLTTLDQAMSAVQNKCDLLVEIKSRVKLTEVIRTSQAKLGSGFPLKDLAFCSFDFRILQKLKENLPGVELVVNEKWSGLRATRRARALATRRVNMNQRWLWRGFLHAMHRRGFQLSPYTVNNPRQAARWQPYLYAIITDHPELFRGDKS
ncbi:MAG: glycerophosphodiester phosphodiesterase [Candidatus Saccharimonadales bacterium]